MQNQEFSKAGQAVGNLALRNDHVSSICCPLDTAT